MDSNIYDAVKNDREFNRIAAEILKEYKDNLGYYETRATGRLEDTASYGFEMDDYHFTFYLELADYWIFLEKGTRPHYPPFAPIRKWIDDKGIVPVPRGKRKAPTKDQLARAIIYCMGHGLMSVNGRLVEKSDIPSGKRVATMSRPAIQVLKDERPDLLQAMVDRIQEILAKRAGKEIETVYSYLTRDISDINVSR